MYVCAGVCVWMHHGYRSADFCVNLEEERDISMYLHMSVPMCMNVSWICGCGFVWACVDMSVCGYYWFSVCVCVHMCVCVCVYVHVLLEGKSISLASVRVVFCFIPYDNYEWWQIEMAQKVLSNDMASLVNSMKLAQQYSMTPLDADYRKRMLKDAHALAMDSKNLLDTVDSARTMCSW